jgi:hypothetical protein
LTPDPPAPVDLRIGLATAGLESGTLATMARIDDYRFGHIVIDGEEQTRDVIILPGRLVTNWWRRDGHSLVLADLDDVIDELPEHLVIGSGAYGRMHPDPAALEDLRRRGIDVEVLRRQKP